MLRTEAILEKYGLSLQDLKGKFPEIEQLLELIEQPATPETSAILQTIDLRLSQVIDIAELEKIGKKTNSKKPDFDLDRVQEEIAKTGDISAFFDDDEIESLFNEGIEIADSLGGESEKIMLQKIYSRIDISEFLVYFTLGKIPMISENMDLIVREDGVVVQAVFNNQFKAALQVQAEPILPLNGAEVDVVISSYDRSVLDNIAYGNYKPLIIEVEDDLPKEANDAELSSLFTSQMFDGKAYRFDYVQYELENLDESFSNWSLPVGALISPELTRFSNYYITPKSFYSLVANRRLVRQVGLSEGSYVTNSCEESKKKSLVIYERSGSANLNFEFIGQSFDDLVRVDEQFESFVAPQINEALQNSKKCEILGFSPIGANGKSGIDHGGYFVISCDALPNFMFTPAVVINYFKKYHDIDTVEAYDNNPEFRTVIFKRGRLVVGIYELPIKLLASTSVVSQVYPTNALSKSEFTYSRNTLNFLNKIDLMQVLGEADLQEGDFEEEPQEIRASEMEFDESWEMVYEDAEFMVDMYLENPDEEVFLDDAMISIELLEENGFIEKANELRVKLQAVDTPLQGQGTSDSLDDIDIEQFL